MNKFLRKISIRHILIGLIAILNIFLIQLPLTNIVGYEFSVVNAFFLFLLSGFIVIDQFNNDKTVSINNIYRKVRKPILVFIVLPFLIGITNTIFFEICPIWDGLGFYFVLTIPSVILGIFLATIISNLFQRWRYILFISIFLLVSLSPVYEIFFNPQVYFYNPIIGYFPGNMYDEDVSASIALIFYRFINLTFFGVFAFYSFGLEKIRFGKIFFIAFFTLFAAVFSLLKPELGFSTDFSSISKNLTNKIETEHFLILYPDEITPEHAKIIALEHEYYFEKIAEELLVKPSQRITSFIFKDGAQKRELFGAGNADVAKPWLYQIYVNFTNYSATLKHELVHIFAAEFGTTPFLVAENINPAMIEGIAMAIENDYAGNHVHYITALAYKSGYNFPISSLFSGFNFMTQTSSLSYTFAGSFVRYLIDNYGIEPVKHLYSDINFNKHFDRTLDSLQADYYHFLDSLRVTENKNTANLYFGRQPLIRKICPRWSANKLKSAWDLYRRKEFYEANQLFREIYERTKVYNALSGMVFTAIRLDQTEEIETLLLETIPDYDSTSYEFNLEILLSDIFVFNEKYEKADSVLSELIMQNPSRNYTNYGIIKQKVLQILPDSSQPFIKSASDKKLNILQKIPADFTNPEFLTYSINFVDDTSGYNWIMSLSEKFSYYSEAECYFAYRFSEFLLNQSEIDQAKSFAVKSLNYDWNWNDQHILTQNLQKLNWFDNFADQIKINFINER
ncbi:MAG: hypothetical protein K9J16_13815 [Melioribacteraceae bacterium]|nr:hypothetical protein [Melioribacteraceae bacterium]MCF8355490.1 hypothetical protein [Melioribacteraceae bacterium]MCF8394915.1 hypothetical protein [Melioribacteraceae bacterium]MCF8420443.1 hypothetical protein [Melioribacteraceae bacterium]